MLVKYSTPTLCNPAGTSPFAVHLADISQFNPAAPGKEHQNPNSSRRADVSCLLFNSRFSRNMTTCKDPLDPKRLWRELRILHHPSQPRRAPV